jgi:hypothetical protein
MEKKMKMKIGISLSMTSICLLLTSCTASDLGALTSQGSGVSTAEVKFAATDSSQVKLYYGNHDLPKHIIVLLVM